MLKQNIITRYVLMIIERNVKKASRHSLANLGSKLGSHHIKEGSLTSVLGIGYT